MKDLTPNSIPHKMLSQDAFSQWLGIEILEADKGKCKVAMTVRREMLNSMGKAHGGISYSLADTAFGFAANTHGKYAVSIETSINHIEALNEGDYLVAESVIEKVNNKLGFNIVEVKRGDELVALFKGVVYRTSKDWE
jgi:acyl-CoA thioesterase